MRAVCLLACAALCATAGSFTSSALTVSGISAGGAMAVQYQVAFSSKVRAAGVVAGLPWYCPQTGGSTSAYECMDDPFLINTQTLNGIMNTSAAIGDIDPVENIKRQSVTLFSGTVDSVVSHGAMIALSQQYTELGITNQVTFFNYTAEHAWITNNYGNSCWSLGEPYINNCGLDFAGVFLEQSWKHMGLHWNSQKGTQVASNLMAFSMAAFGADPLSNSLNSTGYYYLPTACRSTGDARCHVHVSFHGCEQGTGYVGDDFIVHSGLNEWAEANNIAILYPQIISNILLGNENGCFDWWGYTGSNYVAKTAPQIAIVDAAVRALIANGTLPSL